MNSTSFTETSLMPDAINFKSLDNYSKIEGETAPSELISSFSDILKSITKNTNDLQIQSEELSRKFVLGEVNNVHEVMLAIQKAQIALDFTVEIKNQIVQAYKSLERMQ